MERGKEGEREGKREEGYDGAREGKSQGASEGGSDGASEGSPARPEEESVARASRPARDARMLGAREELVCVDSWQGAELEGVAGRTTRLDGSKLRRASRGVSGRGSERARPWGRSSACPAARSRRSAAAARFRPTFVLRFISGLFLFSHCHGGEYKVDFPNEFRACDL